MAKVIRAFDNKNQPIVDSDNKTLSRTYFNIVALNKDQEFEYQLDGFESVCVILSGKCDITINAQTFNDVGQRQDIWTGKADSVYISASASVFIRAKVDQTKFAIAGGLCDKVQKSFRILPDDVSRVDVGSVGTHSHRQIFHILGSNNKNVGGHLLVSELYCEEGCWNGYPPHKHDEDISLNNGDMEETAFDEVYYYQFQPETGFGGQFIFHNNGSSNCFMTHHGDTFLVDKGYHPTVTSPGHKEYIFTILVGHTGRSLVQNFKEEYRYLMNKIPGIANMREKFK